MSVTFVLVLCLLLAVALVLFLYILGRRLFVDDPAKTAALARQILDYDLPGDYREVAVVGLGASIVLMISPPTSATGASVPPTITVSRYGRLARPEYEELPMRSLPPASTPTERRTAAIRCQIVELTTYESIDTQGRSIRTILTGIFMGKSGPTSVQISGPAQGWHQFDMNLFLRSIR